MAANTSFWTPGLVCMTSGMVPPTVYASAPARERYTPARMPSQNVFHQGNLACRKRQLVGTALKPDLIGGLGRAGQQWAVVTVYAAVVKSVVKGRVGRGEGQLQGTRICNNLAV